MGYLEDLQEMIEAQHRLQPGCRVLEAGCGSASRFTFYPDMQLTGIDISPKQLARNRIIQHKILGDIQNYELPTRYYDLIICWDVLEHLDRPRLALDNFFEAVAPGGLIVLKQPNPMSVKGLLTKLTPYRFHRWVYRRIFKVDPTGTEGRTPFRTFMRLAITPHRLCRYARNQGMVVVYRRTVDAAESPFFRQRPVICALYKAARTVGGILSLGLLGKSESIVVLARPATAVPRAPGQSAPPESVPASSPRPGSPAPDQQAHLG